jgi:hypothetical protein
MREGLWNVTIQEFVTRLTEMSLPTFNGLTY